LVGGGTWVLVGGGTWVLVGGGTEVLVAGTGVCFGWEPFTGRGVNVGINKYLVGVREAVGVKEGVKAVDKSVAVWVGGIGVGEEVGDKFAEASMPFVSVSEKVLVEAKGVFVVNP